MQTLWQKTVRPSLQGFLNKTKQSDGDFLLCLPLAGEGRTLTSDVPRATVSVTFPEHPADAAEAIYVFAHEIVGPVAQEAIRKNVTPAQQRSGVAATWKESGGRSRRVDLIGLSSPIWLTDMPGITCVPLGKHRELRLGRS